MNKRKRAPAAPKDVEAYKKCNLGIPVNKFEVKKYDSCDNFWPTYVRCYCDGYHCVGDCDPEEAEVKKK